MKVPGFLPDLPGIRRDVRNYQDSVKRADDTFGAIIAGLRASGLEEDTLVVFLSDHGMPFPFAKSSVYDNGLRTPLILRWPAWIAPGSFDHGIVSAVDLMPAMRGATAPCSGDHAIDDRRVRFAGGRSLDPAKAISAPEERGHRRQRQSFLPPPTTPPPPEVIPC